MKLRITRISPVRASLTVACVSGVLMLIYVVAFILSSLLFNESSSHFLSSAYGSMLLVPCIYFVAIYFIAVLFCLIYNLIAKWTGGLEIIVEENGEDA